VGDAFVILQQHWALDEKALPWLEQGECLLDGDTVYPYKPELAGPGRWPRMGGGERATIFVSEHDLQRLMAKQEVKQEAAPRLDVKSPPLSGEPLEHAEKPEPEPTRPAEPKLLKPAAWFDDERKKNRKHKNERLAVYAGRLHGSMLKAYENKRVTKLWERQTLLRRFLRDSRDK
jgi:hypothetical protein